MDPRWIFLPSGEATKPRKVMPPEAFLTARPAMGVLQDPSSASRKARSHTVASRVSSWFSFARYSWDAVSSSLHAMPMAPCTQQMHSEWVLHACNAAPQSDHGPCITCNELTIHYAFVIPPPPPPPFSPGGRLQLLVSWLHEGWQNASCSRALMQADEHEVHTEVHSLHSWGRHAQL